MLLVAERIRLPILLPARDLKSIRVPLVDALAHVLLSLNVPALSVRRELEEMRDGAFATTNNRSVLGTMNDFSNATWWRYRDGMPHNPFFSPDGQWVGFIDGFSGLKRVPAAGGRVETICRLWQPELTPTWGDDGSIVFSMSNGLWRVAASGGTPEQLLPNDAAAGRVALRTPHFLPGDHALLYGVTLTGTGAQAESNSRSRSAIGILDLNDRSSRIAIHDATNARYVRSGHLIFQSGVPSDGAAVRNSRAGETLRAVRFDLDRLEIVGEPVTLDEPVFTTPLAGWADLDISANGTLVYVPASVQPSARRLVWIDREGREERIDLPVRAYAYPSIAPSGKQVALDVRDRDSDIWIWDIGLATLRRLTFDPGVNQYPVWFIDGRRLLSMAGPTVRWQPPDGSGAPEVLTTVVGVTAPYSSSADGKQLVFRQSFHETGMDASLVRLAESRTSAQDVVQRVERGHFAGWPVAGVSVRRVGLARKRDRRSGVGLDHQEPTAIWCHAVRPSHAVRAAVK